MNSSQAKAKINAIRELVESEGWKELSEIINERLEILQAEVNSLSRNRSIDEDWRLRVERAMMASLLDLPRQIIIAFDSGEDEFEGLDPYIYEDRK